MDVLQEGGLMLWKIMIGWGVSILLMCCFFRWINKCDERMGTEKEENKNKMSQS
jgi:hypothetical protein